MNIDVMLWTFGIALLATLLTSIVSGLLTIREKWCHRTSRTPEGTAYTVYKPTDWQSQ